MKEDIKKERLIEFTFFDGDKDYKYELFQLNSKGKNVNGLFPLKWLSTSKSRGESEKRHVFTRG